jgi:hypothetical protein
VQELLSSGLLPGWTPERYRRNCRSYRNCCRRMRFGNKKFGSNLPGSRTADGKSGNDGDAGSRTAVRSTNCS